MFSANKNSYLQSIYSTVDHHTLNRCVDKARELKNTDPFDAIPAFQRLSSVQPSCLPPANVDLTRCPVGFGRWAIPKLIHDVCEDGFEDSNLKALLTICDLIHDPEYRTQAVTLKLDKRLMKLLGSKQKFVLEKVLLAYKLLANDQRGKENIAKNENLLSLLRNILSNPKVNVQIELAGLLEMLAESFHTADVLVDAGFVQTLMDIINPDQIEAASAHLTSLKHLMYGNGKDIALKYGGFDVLVQMLTCHYKLAYPILECLRVMCSSSLGQKLSADSNLITIVDPFLNADDPKVFTSATAVLMFCTLPSEGRLQAAKHVNLPGKLVRLAKNPVNPALQVYAMNTITNLSEYPPLRKTFQEPKYYKRLQKISDEQNEEVKYFKKVMLDTIFWSPEIIGCPQKDLSLIQKK